MSFTPEQITEILQIYFDNFVSQTYTGMRYVPIIGRRGESSAAWDNSAPYEPLTIVIYNNESYTSRQYVPAGVAITNTDYWVKTGAYNAQIVALQDALPIAQFDSENTVKDYIDELGSFLPASDFDNDNTVKAYIDGVADLLPSSAFDSVNTVRGALNGRVRAFETVTDIAAATDLVADMICHTNGFYTSGDGGAAFYEIKSTGTANAMDIIACQDSLKAHLVITDPFVTPEQFGAYGDGTHDDTNAIKTAIANTSILILQNTYLISDTLEILQPLQICGKGEIIVSPTFSENHVIKYSNDIEIHGIKIKYEPTTSSGNKYIIANDNTNDKNVYLHDITIDISGVSSQSIPIWFADGNVKIENISINNNCNATIGGGIWGTAYENGINAKISNCNITSNSNDENIALWADVDNVFLYCDIDNCTSIKKAGTNATAFLNANVRCSENVQNVTGIINIDNCIFINENSNIPSRIFTFIPRSGNTITLNMNNCHIKHVNLSSSSTLEIAGNANIKNNIFDISITNASPHVFNFDGIANSKFNFINNDVFVDSPGSNVSFIVLKNMIATIQNNNFKTTESRDYLYIDSNGHLVQSNIFNMASPRFYIKGSVSGSLNISDNTLDGMLIYDDGNLANDSLTICHNKLLTTSNSGRSITIPVVLTYLCAFLNDFAVKNSSNTVVDNSTIGTVCTSGHIYNVSAIGLQTCF